MFGWSPPVLLINGLMYNNSYDGWKDRTPIRAFPLPSVYVYSVYVSVSVSVSDGSVSVSLIAELRLLTDPCLIIVYKL